ncbi:GTPase IMAP family member 9-like [Saccostrea echinata]|uniref:GTPase IMAP family member 9-like n=1 Tax=Saccostrea echinata TaxID=191078 RepID=UPI002A80730A|nr:GTPase IMAP family member 9-like [Saccostrea echinata]
MNLRKERDSEDDTPLAKLASKYSKERYDWSSEDDVPLWELSKRMQRKQQTVEGSENSDIESDHKINDELTHFDEMGVNAWFKKESDSDDELRVLIIGQSGSGKSSLANTILGHETFKSNALGDSQTKTIYAGNTHRFGRNIVVVDTPGLFDRSMSNSEVLFEIAKCYAVTSPGLHSILLTIAIGRIDNQNLQETVDLFLEEFGETALSFMIVVFTNKHLLEAENMSIEDYLSSFSKSSSLLTLLQKIKGRYVAVGYKGDRRERIKEAETIISMIDKMLRDQPLKLFQNEVYKKTEKTLTTEAERMVQAVKHNQNVEKKISKMNPQEIRLRTRKIIIEEKYSDENDGENEISFSKILKQILSFIVRSKIGI